MRILLATLALLFGLTTANAQIAGQNDPQFKAALELWLDGKDDLAAITALSELAKADNRAAQVFLGRVETMQHTHRHITGDMDRKARHSLLRAQGGAFGKSWLRIAAIDTPLATPFLNVDRPRERLTAIVQLLKFQEFSAATEALGESMGAIIGDDFKPINKVLKHSTIPIHMRNYFHSTEGFWETSKVNFRFRFSFGTNYSKEQLMQQDAFNWPFYTLFDLNDGKVTADQIDPYIVNNPVFAPLQNLCSETCENDVPKCMRALYFKQFWVFLHSPSESLLSNDRYFASPRISGDLKRLLEGYAGALSKQLRQYDQCAYQAVFAE